MTKLTAERRVKRETAAEYRRRPLVVELFPHWMSVRVKGTREVHMVSWEAVLDLGRRLDARNPLKTIERKRA